MTISWKVAHFIAATGFVSILYGQGSVSLVNVSYPFTTLEVGDYVEVDITGAASYGTVTVVQNGGSPYVFGTTNINGAWSTGPVGPYTGSNVGNYSQTWYVNGVALTPNNPALFSYAPSLPSFAVSGGYLPSNPGVLTSVNACGGNSNVTPTWAWTPVSYVPSTSYGSSVVDAAAGNWNSAQNKISFQDLMAQYDISVYDSNSLPMNVYGQTAPYSQACDYSCYGLVDECNGACLGSSAMYFAEIQLNTSTIDAVANARGVSSSSEATDTLTHEFGHTLAISHEPISFGVCSEVASVMADFAMAELCGIAAPTSRDTNVFNGIYPSGPGYCTPGSNYCESTPCQ